MKKLALLCLAGLFLILLIASCGQKEEPKTETPAVEETTKTAMPDSAAVPDSMMMEGNEAVEEGGH